jgi:hypothetical protein
LKFLLLLVSPVPKNILKEYKLEAAALLYWWIGGLEDWRIEELEDRREVVPFTVG